MCSGTPGCVAVRPFTCASYTTVSLYGVRGARSSAQSKYGFVTTPFGTCGAESACSAVLGCAQLYANTDSSQSTWPSTAFAYGSSSSLAGLHRWPWAGSYGPCTR